MAEIRSPRLLYLKGGLLLAVGLLASALLIAEHPTWKVALLLALAVWGLARAYYFAFYVIEHYVDESYKYSGLLDFLRYALKRRDPPGAGDGTSHGDG
jgi:hypothetical protein